MVVDDLELELVDEVDLLVGVDVPVDVSDDDRGVTRAGPGAQRLSPYPLDAIKWGFLSPK